MEILDVKIIVLPERLSKPYTFDVLIKILENSYYLLREFLWKITFGITLYLLRHLEYSWLHHLLHAWHYGMSADPDPGTRFYRGLKILQIGLLVFDYRFLLGLDITL